MDFKFARIGQDIGKTVEEKNKRYGSAYKTVGQALRLLYPDGIPVEEYEHAMLLVRVWDKMCRISTPGRLSDTEDPYADIAGYGILGVSLCQEDNE